LFSLFFFLGFSTLITITLVTSTCMRIMIFSLSLLNHPAWWSFSWVSHQMTADFRACYSAHNLYSALLLWTPTQSLLQF
jgi:hypothetical protein